MIFGKTCIEIVNTPKGEAPQWVREKWIDRRLPLETIEKHKGPSRGVISGRPGFAGGYVVDAILAITILELHDQDANFWWRDNAKIAYIGGPLIFDEDACKVVEELPSFAYSVNQPGVITVGEFFGRLYEELDDSERMLFDNIQSTFRLEWNELCRRTLTIPMVLVFAKIVAREVNNHLNRCSSEQMFEQLHRDGHLALQAFHGAARSCGIWIPEELIDLPLCSVDIAVRRGIVKVNAEGTVVLTEQGEENIEIEKRRQSAQNN